jgi:hypothetical protein
VNARDLQSFAVKAAIARCPSKRVLLANERMGGGISPFRRRAVRCIVESKPSGTYSLALGPGEVSRSWASVTSPPIPSVMADGSLLPRLPELASMSSSRKALT